MKVIWTDYLKFRVKQRGFDLSKIEDVVRYSSEIYYDTVTGRRIAVGRYNNDLIMIPYDVDEGEDSITPVTVHVTTRQQINFRIRTGRFKNE